MGKRNRNAVFLTEEEMELNRNPRAGNMDFFVHKGFVASERDTGDPYKQIIATWKCLRGIARTGWEEHGVKNDLDGINAFIWENVRHQMCEKPLLLVLPQGMTGLSSLWAKSAGRGEIRCYFRPGSLDNDQHLRLYFQQTNEGKYQGKIKFKDYGSCAASPVIIDGLEPGAHYLVYAVLTDRAYSRAKAVSWSESARSASGI